MLTEREEMLNNILVTAVEGGINYWAHVDNYNSGMGPGLDYVRKATVTVHETTPHTRHGVAKVLKVTHEDLERAIDKLCTQRNLVAARVRKNIAAQVATPEDCDLDSADCDLIVQVAVLGKVVYG